jgi:hypothetical protein
MNSYLSVEEVIENYTPNYLADGCHSVFTVNINNVELFYKPAYAQNSNSKFTSHVKAALHNVDVVLKQYFLSRDCFLDYVENGNIDNHDYTLDIESKILSEWNKRGISSVSILENQKKALVFKSLNAINYGKLLKQKDSDSHYEKLLNVITSIRSAAKSENNPLLLHPDLLPKNFLYCLDSNTAVAIDPGAKLRDKNLGELDAKLNIRFLYSLYGFDRNEFYIDSFLNTLDRPEKKQLLQYNIPLDLDIYAYIELRNKLVYNIKTIRGNAPSSPFLSFSPKITKDINKMISRHL